VLQPEVAGAFPGPASGSAFATATRAAVSDGSGSYRFVGLPAGVYRLYFSGLGYRPYSVVVELRGQDSAAFSVGLDADPVRCVRFEPAATLGARTRPVTRSPTTWTWVVSWPSTCDVASSSPPTCVS
jgi:hypothetical protein